MTAQCQSLVAWAGLGDTSRIEHLPTPDDCPLRLAAQKERIRTTIKATKTTNATDCSCAYIRSSEHNRSTEEYQRTKSDQHPEGRHNRKTTSHLSFENLAEARKKETQHGCCSQSIVVRTTERAGWWNCGEVSVEVGGIVGGIEPNESPASGAVHGFSSWWGLLVALLFALPLAVAGCGLVGCSALGCRNNNRGSALWTNSLLASEFCWSFQFLAALAALNFDFHLARLPAANSS